VVIEEMEMGLHPRAISTVLLLVLDLLARGYRVCLSTHSPHVLDVVWALRVCQKHQADPRRLLDLFDVRATGPMRKIAETVLEKDARVYYFDTESGRTQDISDLDPGARDVGESGWGGLTEFSGRAADVVAQVVSSSEQ
jgi:predicted ATP-binding protein involved in virulence